MKNICKIFTIILFLLGSVLVTFAQKAFYLGPDATVNVSDSVVIRLNDYDGVIQWQKSSDLQLWDNIPGATLDTLLFVADTTTYFRAEVIAGDCDPFYSDTTLLHVVKTGVTDIDGNFYPSVIIGNQEWMAENLRVTRDANGNDITRYCYNNDAANCDHYGGLYTWHTFMNGDTSSNTNPSNVQGICPTGWHVPSDAEWTELVDYVVAQGYPNSNVVNGAGNALKSCRQVSSPLGGDCATSEHPRWNSHSTHYGTDEFGFSALPGGYRLLTGGSYYFRGLSGFWWSSTEFSAADAWGRSLGVSYGNVGRNNNDKVNGFSVRCVRDN